MDSLKQLKGLMGVFRSGARQVPLCLALFFICSARSMMLDVDDGEQDCVLIEAKEKDTISGNFEVLTPSRKQDVLVTLRRQTDDVLLYYSEDKVRDYFRKVVKEEGYYELCFMNGGRGGQKRADISKSFQLSTLRGHPDHGAESADEDGDHDAEDGKRMEEDDDGSWSGSSFSDDLYAPGYKKMIGFGLRIEKMASYPDEKEADLQMKLRKEAEKIERNLLNFKDHESNIRQIELVHGDKMSTSASTLMWYAFIEAAVLLVVSWWQVSYIRRFFETKRAI